MIRSLVLLALVAVATANDPWKEDISYFFDPINGFRFLPRTIELAEKKDYINVENIDTTSGFANLTLWVKRGEWCYLVGLLYDENKQIAGIQINHPVEYLNSYYNMTAQGFKLWTHLDVTYAYTRFYWVSEDSETRVKSYNPSKVLQSDYLSVANLDGGFDKIATDSRNLDSVWTKQACIILMGQHYYYQMTPSLTCDKPFYQWFPLTDEKTNQLIGLGFMYLGKSECKTELPSKAAVEMIVPTGPKCLYDLVGKYGASTLHFYFVDRPRLISC
ncbi:hypothetical protein PYW07_008071 [Mythimna separata]|uniref:Uncharacterized protein n=1 Tax=Mythimna separata TaxID=271217 RepID=A0AAD7YPK2_MYTSE|nr:hypothetical protein PYW07_008071 [Mythimna separata]